MLINNCIQGSDEWLNARLGIPTASCFDKIITASGGKSAQSNAYMGKLLAEFINGEPEEHFSTPDMERGTRLEPMARMFYSTITANPVEQVGLVYYNKDKNISCSPDGLMEKRGLEIKCPKLANHIGYTLDSKLPAKYKAQVQGSMWVTGLDKWDFFSYHPDYEPLLITVERDDVFIAKMEKEVLVFSEKLEGLKTRHACATKVQISA
jgi:hypothetical protein